MKKYLLMSIFACTSMVSAQNISKEKVQEVLSTLASDEMKGRLVGTPENQKAAEYIAAQFKANGLDYCTGDSFLVPFDYKGTTVYNVCGVKKGKSDKILGFSAHFDHIGVKNDVIYNGADDNASGTTAIIEIAEYFKTQKPKFSMVFMAFNGEEKGMLGSKAISKDEKLQPIYDKMVALFNLEMLATKSEFGDNAMYITGDEFSDLDELFNKKAVNGLKIHADKKKKKKLFYRSDNVSFVKKRIVAHSFSTVDMNNAKHYHQATDKVDIVNFDNLTNIINNIGATVKKLKPSNFNPQYNDTVKFD